MCGFINNMMNSISLGSLPTNNYDPNDEDDKSYEDWDDSIFMCEPIAGGTDDIGDMYKNSESENK